MPGCISAQWGKLFSSCCIRLSLVAAVEQFLSPEMSANIQQYAEAQVQDAASWIKPCTLRPDFGARCCAHTVQTDCGLPADKICLQTCLLAPSVHMCEALICPGCILADRCKLVDNTCKLVDSACKLVDNGKLTTCTHVPERYLSPLLHRGGGGKGGAGEGWGSMIVGDCKGILLRRKRRAKQG